MSAVSVCWKAIHSLRQRVSFSFPGVYSTLAQWKPDCCVGLQAHFSFWVPFRNSFYIRQAAHETKIACFTCLLETSNNEWDVGKGRSFQAWIWLKCQDMSCTRGHTYRGKKAWKEVVDAVFSRWKGDMSVKLCLLYVKSIHRQAVKGESL